MEQNRDGFNNAGQVAFRFELDDDSVGIAIVDTKETPAGEALDYGDAPDSFGTLLASDGARHDGPTGPRLGATRDSESDAVAPLDGTGDDTSDTGAVDDEDGVSVVANLVASAGSSSISTFSVDSSGAGSLDAWIDFNQDGSWTNDEQILTNEAVVAGVNLLGFDVPAGAMSGNAFSRFRLSSLGGLGPKGAATDGEVEDFTVLILNGDAVGGAHVRIAPPASGTIDVVADGSDVVVRSNSIELFRTSGASLGGIDISGLDGDDTLNVANLGAIFGGLVTGDAGLGNDSLRLTGIGQELDLTQIADSDVLGFETVDITGSGDNTLTLDVNEVLNLSSTTDTLRIEHNVDDVVNYGGGWTAEFPQIVAGQFVHVLKQTGATIEVVNTLPFRNPLRPLDTNRDGTVAPLDALIIINRLNDSGSGSLQTPTSVAGLTEYFYIDTNGDGSVAPIDVIQVINFLNNPSGNPEGEFAVAQVGLGVVDTAGNVSDTAAPDQHDNSTATSSPKELPVGPVAAKESLKHDAPYCAKRLTSGAEDEELVATVDAFFADWEFDTL